MYLEDHKITFKEAAKSEENGWKQDFEAPRIFLRNSNFIL